MMDSRKSESLSDKMAAADKNKKKRKYTTIDDDDHLMMDNIDLESLREKMAAEGKNQQSLGMEDFDGPLDGPPPLGLKLPRTPSFMEGFEGQLNQSAEESKDGAGSGDKFKTSNFNASLLKIGSGEQESLGITSYLKSIQSKIISRSVNKEGAASLVDHQSTSSKTYVEDPLISETSSSRSPVVKQLMDLINLDKVKDMSLADFVNHLKEQISKPVKSNDETLSIEQWRAVHNMERSLSTGITETPPNIDENALLSQVNSLSFLLHKDTDKQSKSDNGESSGFGGSEGAKESDDICGFNELWAMSRKDSFGDSLLNVSRMASLPQFLFKVSEDFESQS